MHVIYPAGGILVGRRLACFGKWRHLTFYIARAPERRRIFDFYPLLVVEFMFNLFLNDRLAAWLINDVDALSALSLTDFL